MPDLTDWNNRNRERRKVWVAGGEIQESLADSRVPCQGRVGVFDAAHKSFVARWVAKTICSSCPLSGLGGACLSAGQNGHEQGVWGGFYSSDGKQWEQVRPVKQSDVMRAISSARGDLKREAAIREVDRIAPGIAEVFLDENGKLRYAWRGEGCILRPSRRTQLPNGEVGSIRMYLMTDVLGVELEEGSLVVHATCSTEGCIAPWHLRWMKAGSGASRAIALALYGHFRKGMKLSQLSDITGLTPKDLRGHINLASLLGPSDRLPEPALGAINETFMAIVHRNPSSLEMTAMVRLCTAADDLDCDTISDLIVAGESEF